jgi:hypothetical protein
MNLNDSCITDAFLIQSRLAVVQASRVISIIETDFSVCQTEMTCTLTSHI